MAIAYVRARPMRMRPHVSMAALVSYCGRSAIVDPRLNRSWTFRGDGSDMVHEEIVLPIGVAPEFANPAAFANAIDYAEARRMRKSDGRTRWPQVCWTLVVALPPDDELTLDEAIEVTRRLVQRTCGPHDLPAHIAIHDPARLAQSHGSLNRHAHVSVGLRPMFVGPKVRDLWARPRHGQKHGLPATYIAEGVSWPEMTRDVLIRFFGELGLDNVVDPSAPAPDRHWSDSDLHGDDDKVHNYRQTQHKKNLALIYGDASTLIETLLRGRSMMRIGEIHRLLAKFVDRESDRTVRANEILADPEIVTLGRPAPGGITTPRFATTRRIFKLISAATDAIEEARRTTAIQVMSGNDHTAVLEQILEDQLRDAVIVGTRQSDCAECATLLNAERSQVVTVAKAIDRESASEAIVVPRAECVVDQDLAALILSAHESRVRLVLGFDLSSQAGHCHGLTSYIADRLSPHRSRTPCDAAQLVRAGLMDQAVRMLHERIVFGFAEDRASPRGLDSWTVCDDPDRLSLLISRAHEMRGLLDPLDHPYSIHADGRDITFYIGEWIVFERTVYGPKPSEIRAGGFGRVLAVDDEHGTLVVDILGLGVRTVDVQKARLRSAAAIRLREAKRAPSEVELRIEISTSRHAWAAILLAAERGNATLFVASAVARTLDELVEVARSSLPSPALCSLKPIRDPDADMHAVYEDILANSHDISLRADDVDIFPEPANNPRHREEADRPAVTLDEFPTPKPGPRLPPIAIGMPSLHERLRSAIASDPHALEGLRFVQRSIHKTNPGRADAYDKIMKFIGLEKSVAAAVVRAEYSASPRARCPDSLNDEFDLPQSLIDELPAALEEIEIFRACTILSLLAQRITQTQITPHIVIEDDTKDPLSSDP
ncbi:hypothetical protein MSC49_31570 [Methylosinus sp. C49]|nr:hypothetical protein MSC49_31570 [Methylosinus sp. C49]